MWKNQVETSSYLQYPTQPPVPESIIDSYDKRENNREARRKEPGMSENLYIR